MSSTPMEVRFRSPPETPFTRGPPIFVFSHFLSRSSSMMLSTRSIFYSKVPGSFNLAANSRHSLTLSVWNKMSSCWTYAEKAVNPLIWSRSCPLTKTRPFFDRFYEIKRPERKLSSVVLPAPDAPMIERNWPGLTQPDTPSRIILRGPLGSARLQQPPCGTVAIFTSYQLSWTGTRVLFTELCDASSFSRLTRLSFSGMMSLIINI